MNKDQNSLQPRILLLAFFVLAILFDALLSQTSHVIPIPLFLDTTFAMGMLFYAGFWAGAAVALASSILKILIFMPGQWSHVYFSICSILGVFVGFLFFRPRAKTSGETKQINNIVIMSKLLLVSVINTLAISLLGGFIAYLLFDKNPAGVLYRSPVDKIVLFFYQQNFNILLSSILARFPVNLIDKTIATFGGYGICLLYRKIRSNELAR